MNVYAVIRGGTKGSGRRSHDQQHCSHQAQLIMISKYILRSSNILRRKY